MKDLVPFLHKGNCLRIDIHEDVKEPSRLPVEIHSKKFGVISFNIEFGKDEFARADNKKVYYFFLSAPKLNGKVRDW